jgi:hypothetical protein
MGFASVRTKSEVTLSVRDMVGFGCEWSERLGCVLSRIAQQREAHDSSRAIRRDV